MDLFKAAERLMAMDEESWQRHANPLSVWTRLTCLPLIALAIASRHWLGWWCLIPVVLSLLWTFLNPRLFKAPATLDSWAAKGVLGERLFLQRKQLSIPDHHLRAARILTALSIAGVGILAYGLFVLNVWAILCGLFVTMLSKTWFVDRMVWIQQDLTSNTT